MIYSYGPLMAFMALVGRMLITGATIGEALAACAAAALHGYQLYLQSETQEPVSQDVRDDIENIKSAINGLKIAKTFTGSLGGR